ncbi:long-chain-fatty-acid--CoA ligase [Flammeovirga yaeyamensis]|uniref:Long-chain-fatty-acid--CoA ligase n=1 Tax=Flammeovirga yaeyamensis TaxID=367791 RepID=A0AAX1NB33_9BACT|nr:long-chain fatty acid--CoA ligase [Flammeovirga yaeyamensis]MBB3698934.1 long-chain acyl-CoA synthetase [Flammeovirga yaeyamensis]NMF36368.1 long-chain fatty acid--CoA ligase [Flammeovirga yaeyamensis]QWG03671.1 long-chain-fatty-acid--CoA ligase [Flammeovirga yaeyamensis]
MFNLSIGLEDASRRFPGKEAIVCGPTRLTFKELNDEASKIASSLQKHGLQKGDHVALSCPNLHYFPMIYYGILKAGGVVVPLSILLKNDEIKYHLEDADAKFYFCFEGDAQLPMGKYGRRAFDTTQSCQLLITLDGTSNNKVENELTLEEFLEDSNTEYSTPQIQSDNTAVIIYTSGTTGQPKGAELSHSNLGWNASMCRHLFKLKEEDKALTVLPLFHIFGQTCLMNTSIMHGITNVIIPRFDAELVLSAIQQEGVSIFAGVPTMYWGLLHFKNEKSTVNMEQVKANLRLCISGGASLPVQVMNDFEAKFEIHIYEGYGMSEGAPVVSFNHPGLKRKSGSIGYPVWGVEVKLVDKQGVEVKQGERGELLYRGHNVMKGYYKRPEATQKVLIDGWMHSGDVARQDEEGYYYIVDRTKDVILRGGVNIYPREIEEVMIQHEAVSLVAVIGIHNDRLGEEIKACVVLEDEHDISKEDLIQWTKSKIADYKYPREIDFFDALPVSATGKILKRALRHN